MENHNRMILLIKGRARDKWNNNCEDPSTDPANPIWLPDLYLGMKHVFQISAWPNLGERDDIFWAWRAFFSLYLYTCQAHFCMELRGLPPSSWAEFCHDWLALSQHSVGSLNESAFRWHSIFNWHWLIQLALISGQPELCLAHTPPKYGMYSSNSQGLPSLMTMFWQCSELIQRLRNRHWQDIQLIAGACHATHLLLKFTHCSQGALSSETATRWTKLTSLWLICTI